jgi:site-specific DNA-methyltransferase (adenine-specific)
VIDNIFYGDCLEEMKKIETNSIDLIYLDPPFFSEKRHTLSSKDRTKEFSFDDIWKTNRAYAVFLEERISIMRELLKDTGSIFVHCDKSAEHIIRAILDNIFGSSNFQSEIIWSYKRWSNSKKGLLPAHQNIYFYSKTEKFKFNKIYTAYSQTTNIDQILQRRTRDKDNKSVYDLDKNGNPKQADPKKGVPLNDVWDIPYLNPKAKERVGYPTQKPLLLLERIIQLCSDEEDTILDPFCGSGTTCVASKLLNRNYIGIDKSLDAIELTVNRLKNPIKTESNLLKKGREAYNNADKEALGLLYGVEYHPVQRNRGIDAILVESYQDTPILVRVQKSSETLTQTAQLLSKAMKIKGSKKSILIQTHNNTLFSETINLRGIILLQSPSLLIKDRLSKTSVH